MSKLINVLSGLALSLFVLSCTDQGAQQGESTPIDSTNIHGTAPVTYGGENPATDGGQYNESDTGTNAANTANNGNPHNEVRPDKKPDTPR